MVDIKKMHLDAHTCYTKSTIPSRWCTTKNTKEYIVIHQTGCMDVNALTMRKSYNNYPVTRSAGCHFFADNSNVIQVVSPEFTTWNCGDGTSGKRKVTNYNSLAVELCIFNDTNKYLGTLEKGAELIAYLMHTYGIPLERVTTHREVSGKVCPAQLLNSFKGVTLQDFYKKIEGYYEMANIKKVNIIIDDKIVEVNAINVNGNNYVKLQDLNTQNVVIGYKDGKPTITTK